jgi:SSS family solute:Na+ symporter/sodium/proline symporter
LVLGGYVATLIADFVQGIIMLGGVALMVGIIMGNPSVGGFLDGARSLINQAAQVPLLDNSQPNNIVNLIALVLLTSVGSWGLPQMIHKFYAIKDDNAIKKGTVISTIFCAIVGGGAYFTGAVAKLYYTVNSSNVPMENGKIAFDRIIPDFLSSTLPDALLGIIIILVLSASVTTLTGIVLASSSSLVIDLIKPKCRNMNDKQMLLTTRIFCAVFIIISVIIAMIKSPIQTLMSFSWGTISGAFLAPYALGLYWKGVTKAGAWSGLAGGAFISVVLALVFQFNASQAPLFGVIAMIGSLVFTVGVSLVTKKYSQAHINHIFEESAEKAGHTEFYAAIQALAVAAMSEECLPDAVRRELLYLVLALLHSLYFSHPNTSHALRVLIQSGIRTASPYEGIERGWRALDDLLERHTNAEVRQ